MAKSELGESLSAYLREKWPELLLVVIVIGGGGFLIGQTLDLRDRSIRQETRVDTIVAALPDLRTRVAIETIYSPFQSALFVSNPQKLGDAWNTTIQVVNPDLMQISSFKLATVAEADQQAALAALGLVFSSDAQAVTAEAAQSFALSSNYTGQLPRTIDPRLSIISATDPKILEEFLGTIGAQKYSTTSIPPVRNWVDLVDEVTAGNVPLGPR